uniref:Uncharacterized protein n=1 Tax=Salix viminalis TaxID=40686 RepID=A0A6N2JXD4_SALVM
MDLKESVSKYKVLKQFILKESRPQFFLEDKKEPTTHKQRQSITPPTSSFRSYKQLEVLLSDGIETDLERTQGSPERSSYFLQRRPCC